MADLAAESIRVGRSVATAADRHRATVQKTWDDATKRARAYVKIVLENNPGTITQVFARPDVQYILEQAALTAHERLVPMIDKAALAGSLLGSRVDGKRNSSFEPNGILSALHKDLDRIATEFPTGVASGVKKAGAESLDDVFRRYSLRAQMVAEAATKMHYTLGMISTMQNSGTKKMWKTTSLEPCGYCKALNGQIREWTDEFVFPEGMTFPIYGGKLLGPQLHPNCRCILVIVTDK